MPKIHPLGKAEGMNFGRKIKIPPTLPTLPTLNSTKILIHPVENHSHPPREQENF
ncbi:hypothetical protein CWATWH0401_3826 [Crocosphaera watsonii WH 0401]|uniref:Uncharacterized protein n=1 Tax=Crocosphaera watsonii WH 0401 TaxID=555881 RepID=T2JC89_CROWT|nr:hypothetical protein CWATWH0401_3826 [Crocosphaera watsonii WH 0401]